jgi:EpsG family
MIPYIVAYFFYITAICININSRYLQNWLLVASIPMISLVFLRGQVGVDLLMYEQAVDLIRAVNTYTFTFEPLFEYAILLFAQQIDNSFVILAIFSAFTTIFLYLGSFKIEDKPYVLAFGIIPYFYFDMTMNGIRYGLAFSIIFYGAQFLVKGKEKIFLGIAILAASIQVSSILLASLLYLLVGMRWRIFFGSVLGAVIVYLLLGEYLQLKLDENKSLAIESSTAGVAPLLLSLTALGACWMDKNARKTIGIPIVFLIIFSLLSYSITQITYAGLRFQQLNLYLIFLYIACVVNQKKLHFSNNLIITFIFLSILSSGFRLKNFYNDAGQGDAPFAPYQFGWER